MTENELCSLIVTSLEEHPEWAPEVFKATHQGLMQAHAAMVQRVEKIRWGLMASLCIAKGTKISVEMKTSLNNLILAALPTSNLSTVERDGILKILHEERT